MSRLAPVRRSALVRLLVLASISVAFGGCGSASAPERAAAREGATPSRQVAGDDSTPRAARAPVLLPARLRLEGFPDGGSRASLADAAARARRALRNDPGRDAVLASVHAAAFDEGRPIGAALARSLAAGPTTEVLLTGYYEPTLAARTRPDARFRHPLYRPPAAGPGRAPTRREIDSGALAGRGLELFWLDDPIEAFFLHVQGSGRLALPDGREVRVGYAATNGHRYHSIGSELVARGAFTATEATAPAIKRWLRAHPAEAAALLHTNPRYVFFRLLETPAGLGPPGSLGASLVPWRSVAADPAVTPPGSVGLLFATLPDGTELARVVVAMDRGAAIRGPGRLDLFLGAGGSAERIAGELRSRGRVAWLALRP